MFPCSCIAPFLAHLGLGSSGEVPPSVPLLSTAALGTAPLPALLPKHLRVLAETRGGAARPVPPEARFESNCQMPTLGDLFYLL